jgi:predicted nucleic acid-binding protein
VADASVLINLIHVRALTLLGRLARFEFVVVEDVVSEIARPEQASALADAITRGWIRRERLERPEGLELFAELSRVLDRGEAASLAWAIIEKAAIACDDRRARREAQARMGDGHIFTTPGVILVAIRDGLLTIEEADHMKETLEANRFRMGFASFRDVF